MTISEFVDLGLEVATARDAAPGRVLAVTGAALVALVGLAAVYDRPKYLPGLSYGMSGGPWSISWQQGAGNPRRCTADELRAEREEDERRREEDASRQRRGAEAFGVPGPDGMYRFTFEITIARADNEGSGRQVLKTPTILAHSFNDALDVANGIRRQLMNNLPAEWRHVTANLDTRCVKPPCVLPEVRK